ncbi:MAG: OsmC family protein [Desulfovibrionaceae bacterium]|nr:OsmC family protein [Desulfovibrionaceae bacterium]MBF0513998.1 OsmC family protein [Desulfovibrionaceae bacterium]
MSGPQNTFDPGAVVPDRTFDGGDLDCGSGLILLIRENLIAVPVGGVLEMRSREPAVGDELPPWCRLTGHEYLGRLPGENCVRYFLRRGRAPAEHGAVSEEDALAADKRRAREYEWRLRVRSAGHAHSTVYCRNFSWELGQPASFEEKDARPCAVEAVLGALGSALGSGFAGECARRGLEIDDIELTVRGRLHNVLAHLGLEPGDASFAAIEVKCFASTMEDEAKVREAWERAAARSPVAATLAKAVELTLKLAVV